MLKICFEISQVSNFRAIDMTLVGYPVKADGKMEEGKWYELQGKIQVENGEPYIEYIEAKQVEEPKENQIY